MAKRRDINPVANCHMNQTPPTTNHSSYPGAIQRQHRLKRGKEEHSARVASISLGMVLLILIPCLLLLVCGANYWIREQIAKEEAQAAAALLPKTKWQKLKEQHEQQQLLEQSNEKI